MEEFRPELGAYEEIYRCLHRKPELSMVERTAALTSEHLKGLGFKGLGFDVINNIGGHGLVGILKNGHMATVMLRADMDALSIEERTGLFYASKKRQLDRHGRETPVMHACGHDVHVACLLGAAHLLVAATKVWSGTVLCLFLTREGGRSGSKEHSWRRSFRKDA